MKRFGHHDFVRDPGCWCCPVEKVTAVGVIVGTKLTWLHSATEYLHFEDPMLPRRHGRPRKPNLAITYLKGSIEPKHGTISA